MPMNKIITYKKLLDKYDLTLTNLKEITNSSTRINLTASSVKHALTVLIRCSSKMKFPLRELLIYTDKVLIYPHKLSIEDYWDNFREFQGEVFVELDYDVLKSNYLSKQILDSILSTILYWDISNEEKYQLLSELSNLSFDNDRKDVLEVISNKVLTYQKVRPYEFLTFKEISSFKKSKIDFRISNN
jgi:antitoxin component HigA of HigAB toxin-antitoxin module